MSSPAISSEKPDIASALGYYQRGDTTWGLLIMAKCFGEGGVKGEAASRFLFKKFFDAELFFKIDLKSEKNTKLQDDQILEIIEILGRDKETADKRIGNDKSGLIADLVEVSELWSANKVYQSLINVPGIDPKKNQSCKRIFEMLNKETSKDTEAEDEGMDGSIASPKALRAKERYGRGK